MDLPVLVYSVLRTKYRLNHNDIEPILQEIFDLRNRIIPKNVSFKNFGYSVFD